jgi:hypothetical protein
LKGSFPTPTRRWTVLGVVAALALSVAVVSTSAGASNWHAASAGDAVAAKKKCKKKKHRSASAAKKKKKCKKKKSVPVVPVAPVPPAGPKPPVVRADISWNSDAEIDLHAWSGGLHDGWDESLGDYDVEIPGTTYTHSSSSEQITDASNPSTRGLTFGICNYGDAGTTDITVRVLYADGTVDNEQFDDTTEGDVFVDPLGEGGTPDPLADWCPAALP